MNFKDRDVIGSTLINFAFWGFLGGAVFNPIYAAITIGLTRVPLAALPRVLPTLGTQLMNNAGSEDLYIGLLGRLFIYMSFLLLAYGFVRLGGRLKPMMIFGGLISALLNIIPLLITFPSPWPTILSFIAVAGLFSGLIGWLYSLVRGRVDGNAMNLMSGWGSLLVVAVIGGLFSLNTVFAGYNTYIWGMVFSGSLGFLMTIGGLVMREHGPINDKS